jgi:hypothetical protein
MFGTQFVYGNPAASLATGGDLRMVGLADGSAVAGRAVVIATGVSYRRLDVFELESLAGAGVFYGAAATEARALGGRRAFVVGGGNSAGQAAVHLSKYAQQVSILVGADSLAGSMSEYLIREIDTAANIDVRYRTEVAGGGGDGRLEQLRLRRRDTGDTETEPADGLFILIGAQPFTQWLPEAVAATSGASSSPAQTWPNAGPCRGKPTCSKPAHPACSPPATSGQTRRIGRRRGVDRHPPGSRLPCVASAPSARQPGPIGDAPNPASMIGAGSTGTGEGKKQRPRPSDTSRRPPVQLTHRTGHPSSTCRSEAQNRIRPERLGAPCGRTRSVTG